MRKISWVPVAQPNLAKSTHCVSVTSLTFQVLFSTSGIKKLVLAGNAWRDNGLQAGRADRGCVLTLQQASDITSQCGGIGYIILAVTPRHMKDVPQDA